MKKQKLRQSIIGGYKRNYKFCKDQISKILNLDSFHQYLSINLYYPDSGKLIDEILPCAIDFLNDQFPFVVIRSCSLNYVEIVVVSTLNYFDCCSELQSIEGSLSEFYPGVQFN